MGYICGCVLSYSANFKSKEFCLSYTKLSENCAIAELTNLLELIVYKYNNMAVCYRIVESVESSSCPIWSWLSAVLVAEPSIAPLLLLLI